jgi:hypothetical protein
MVDDHGKPGEADEPQAAVTEDPALAALRLLRGTPVYGSDGTRLGELSRDGFVDGYLVMRRVMGDPEIQLPESVIVRHDATGVHTDLSWRELEALLPPPPPGSEMGLLDAFATGAEAAHANRFDEDDVPE